MNIGYWVAAALFGGLAAFMIFTAGWERPPMETVQNGYRGLALEQVINPRTQAIVDARNQVPELGYQPEPGGPRASEIYENVRVLGDLGEEQFTTLMANITQWVSPEQGCAYCHNEENLAEDSVYTKVVARRMLQMTAGNKGSGVTKRNDLPLLCKAHAAVAALDRHGKNRLVGPAAAAAHAAAASVKKPECNIIFQAYV